MIGLFHYGSLSFICPFGNGIGGYIGHIAGGVAGEYGAAGVVGHPGDGAVGDGFGEDDDSAGFAGDLAYVFLVFFIPSHFLGTGVVAFVTAGDEYKSAVSGVDVGELESDHGEAVVHFAVAEDVILVGVESGA